MKKYSYILALLFFASLGGYSQTNLVFKGTVKCYIANDPNSTKGAKNVVVVPGFIPVKTGITGSQGYYEINTGVPLQKLEGKYVTVYYISSCKDCEQKKNVFVSEDQTKVNAAKQLSFLTIETMLMNAGCSKTELKAFQSDSILTSFTRQPGQDLDKASALNVVTASPGLLNLLTTVVSAPVIVNAGTFFADVKGLQPSHINGYGNFLQSSPMVETGNTGFNFSPNRDLSEAVFWNPSDLANNYHTGGANLFTNLKNNFKLSGYAKLTERFSLGVGGIYTQQDEFRPTRFTSTSNNRVTVLHLEKLKEYAAFLAPSVKLSEKLSVGFAAKSIWQTFNAPKRVEITQSPDRNDFFDSSVKRQKFDADFSVTYNVTPSFKAGINVMNIAGTELFADAFAAGQKDIPFQKLRSLGIGLCYKWKQFNVGTDVLLTEDDLYDVSLGVNYVPFNNALLSGGYAFKQQSFSLSFRLKYFRVSYVNDNGLMVNDQRKGKSSIFNGQVHSGFAFTF